MNGGHELSDALRAFHQGDDAALGEVQVHVLAIATSWARRLGLPIEDAQDAAGKLIVTLLRRRSDLHVASYVATRVRGELLDVLARRRGTQQPPAEEAWDPPRSAHLPTSEEALDSPDQVDIESVIEAARDLARDEATRMRKKDGVQLVATLDGLIEVRLRRTLTQEELAERSGLKLNALQARESRTRLRLLERCEREKARSPELAAKYGPVDRLVRLLAGHQ